jgi:hypothetical protein
MTENSTDLKIVPVKQFAPFSLVRKPLIPCMLQTSLWRRPSKTAQNAFFRKKSVLKSYRRFFVFGDFCQNRSCDEKNWNAKRGTEGQPFKGIRRFCAEERRAWRNPLDSLISALASVPTLHFRDDLARECQADEYFKKLSSPHSPAQHSPADAFGAFRHSISMRAFVAARRSALSAPLRQHSRLEHFHADRPRPFLSR